MTIYCVIFLSMKPEETETYLVIYCLRGFCDSFEISFWVRVLGGEVLMFGRRIKQHESVRWNYLDEILGERRVKEVLIVETRSLAPVEVEARL